MCDCMYAHMFVCPCRFLFVSLSVCLLVCVVVGMSVCVYVYLSVWVADWLAICLSDCLPAYLTVCLSVCRSVRLSVRSSDCFLAGLSSSVADVPWPVHLSIYQSPCVCLGSLVIRFGRTWRFLVLHATMSS